MKREKPKYRPARLLEPDAQLADLIVVTMHYPSRVSLLSELIREKAVRHHIKIQRVGK